MNQRSMLFQRLAVIALCAALWTAAGYEFYNMTWGTGKWLGEFSFKWGMAFFLFVLFGELRRISIICFICCVKNLNILL